MIVFLVVLVIVLAFSLSFAFPLIAFLTVPGFAASIPAAFTAEGWNTAMTYLSSSPNWDRWLLLVCLGATGLFWLTCFIANFAKGHPGRALGSFVGLGVFLITFYIYIGWPNNADFALWQQILLYIHFICTPLGLLSTAMKGFGDKK